VFLIEIAIEPKSEADRARLDHALLDMAAGDPRFGHSLDPESGQIVLKGVSEEQLDRKVDVLRSIYKVEANVGAPQVAYRETLGHRAEIDFTHKQQTGASGQFARVKLLFEPSEPGVGYAFANGVASETLPDEFVAGIEHGLRMAKERGLVAGFPVSDFKATLVDAAYHDVDSSVMAFEIAARAAFRELRNKAAPVLLEPVMKAQVTTPSVCVGDVVDDLRSRRGQIKDVDSRDGPQVIKAVVPLANMLGYVSTLRVMTQGGASFHMEFDHYQVVPEASDPDPDLFPPAAAMRA
jgi:elongation factor G